MNRAGMVLQQAVKSNLTGAKPGTASGQKTDLNMEDKADATAFQEMVAYFSGHEHKQVSSAVSDTGSALEKIMQTLINMQSENKPATRGKELPAMMQLVTQPSGPQLDAITKEDVQQVLATLGNGQADEKAIDDVMKLLQKAANHDGSSGGGEVPAADTGSALEKIMQTLINMQSENKPATGGKALPAMMQLVTQPSGPKLGVTAGEFKKNMAAEAEKLLSQPIDQKNMPKMAQALLKLLDKWTTFTEKSPQQQINMPFSEGNEKLQAVWKELLQAYQKRNKLVSNQQYNVNARVTGADVSKWLQSAMKKHGETQGTVHQPSMTFTASQPMSKPEQFVIHLNQTQNTNAPDQPLMDQFRKIMSTSKFFTMHNGTSQLNITLRPENLGDITVKLTQMNGEMTVKMVVTSAAAKDMLESNMHQLKNMFSPQQVVIEKQDLSSQQAQTEQQGQGEQTKDQHDQEGSNQSDHDDELEDENDFNTHFEDALLNEEV
ncbi:flagellar hook-length control protein FliK [Lentibacillus lipolyticus]|nr:flagellar hook-length control protein FliK [Lentibacillus lipolyticus]